MTPQSRRPMFARVAAVALTAVLTLAGGALPAFAEGSPDPASPDAAATSALGMPAEPADGPVEPAPVEPAPADPEHPVVDPGESNPPALMSARSDARAAAPALVVSKTTGLDASGETVTVTGSGYNPAQPMYLILCSDIPLDDVSFSFAARCTAGAQQISNHPTTPTMVKLEDDGTFTTTFTVSRKEAFTTGTAIYTVANHTAQTDRTQDAKQSISFTPLLTVTPATGLDPAGQTVTVTGAGYNPAQPMYLFVCRDVPVSEVDFVFASGCTRGAKQISNTPTTATMVKLEDDGTFSTTLTITGDAALASGAAVYTAANHTARDDRTQDARRQISFTGATPTTTTITAPAAGRTGETIEVSVAVTPSGAGSVQLTGAGAAQTSPLDGDGTARFSLSGLDAATYTLVATFTPADPLVRAGSSGTTVLEVTPPPSPAATQVGTLTWGIKAEFRDYVTGPIAQGTIVTSGATSAGGAFGFTQTGGALDDAGAGSISYGGSVRFTGHHGELDVRLSDPMVRIASNGSATVFVRIDGGSPVAFATLRLAGGTRSVANGVVTYRGVPAVLSAAGAPAFAGFYAAGDPLDALTFSIGAAGAPSGGTRTVAAFTSTPDSAPPATPPATEGASSDSDEFVEGRTYTFTADGFQPGESGILAVIYSEPTVLASDLTADAAGAVTWRGKLPRGLTGEHTFTFQGSVDRGIVVRIAPAEVVGCTVDGAELHWGFKESFRAYLDGSIANGEWSTAGGATYETPVFTWSGGAGGYDSATAAVDLEFPGSVRFTGHGAILDTTIANPRIVIEGDRGMLLVDVFGTTQDGSPVDGTALEFAELDLTAAHATDGDVVTLTGIRATLTAAGSDAFGTYPAGEELDPLELRIPVDPACAEPVAATGDEAAIETENASGAAAWPWIVFAILAALLVAGVAVALVLRSRRA